ncbi:hypothetical protein GOP47_0016060 [Adiantum capillus-veneris]|uniref:Uncharacterized protein n=1 Tax=Adiantum capillus-veneris TaxID=13818 RepID=A0A9D4ZC64_ADICA|nr:hypothetical protein GOP47_0016060 [Adiantum capillus-veneris]
MKDMGSILIAEACEKSNYHKSINITPRWKVRGSRPAIDGCLPLSPLAKLFPWYGPLWVECTAMYICNTRICKEFSLLTSPEDDKKTNYHRASVLDQYVRPLNVVARFEAHGLR